jgi:hypothetical protein
MIYLFIYKSINISILAIINLLIKHSLLITYQVKYHKTNTKIHKRLQLETLSASFLQCKMIHFNFLKNVLLFYLYFCIVKIAF